MLCDISDKQNPKRKEFQCIEQVANWSPVSDFTVVGQRRSGHYNAKSRMFVSSGRKGAGYISELLTGLEGRIKLSIDLPPGANFVWSLNSIWGNYLLVSYMRHSILLQYGRPKPEDSDEDMEDVQQEWSEIDTEDTDLVLDEHTFAAAVWENKIIQVTGRAIRVVDFQYSKNSLQNVPEQKLPSETRICAAVIHTNMAFIALHRGNSYLLNMYAVEGSG
jgi:hypothetical protein